MSAAELAFLIANNPRDAALVVSFVLACVLCLLVRVVRRVFA